MTSFVANGKHFAITSFVADGKPFAMAYFVGDEKHLAMTSFMAKSFAMDVTRCHKLKTAKWLISKTSVTSNA